MNSSYKWVKTSLALLLHRGLENHFLIGHLGFLEFIVHIYEFKLSFTLFEGCRLTPPTSNNLAQKLFNL
jgi:hypothetical protein